MTPTEHVVVEPRVMYFGTPVVLISSTNEDGSANLAPMSSAWWIESSCMLGLDETSQTTHNLRRTGELVLNLADAGMVDAVDRLACLTGNPVLPAHKQAKRYRFCADKFGAAGLTPRPSLDVVPPRVAECLIQLEARVEDVRVFAGPGAGVLAVEARVVRSHVARELVQDERAGYIDADRWDPLIMTFTHFYGGGRNLRSSRMAEAFEIPSPPSTAVRAPR